MAFVRGRIVVYTIGDLDEWIDSRRQSDGVELRCSDGRVGAGLDIKADGGHILAPPSSRTEGHYQWIAGGPRDLQEAPGWLVGAARPPVHVFAPRPITELPRASSRYVQKALEEELRRVETAANGTRRATLNSAAFALGGLIKAGVLDESSTAEALLTHAIATGLSSHEARITIAHAFEDAPERRLAR